MTTFRGCCLRGQARIYPLTLGSARRASPERQPVQVRGKHRRPPTAEERGWGLSWLTQQGIGAINRV